MLIEHRQYLALLDEIDFLKKDNQLLREENLILAQELCKEKEQRLRLQDHHQKNLKIIQELHAKTITCQADNTKSIIDTINDCNTATKSFLQGKFQILENATTDQARQKELKQAKNKLDLYELNDFANKIRAIHKQTQNAENNQNAKVSLGALVKWIKGLTLVASTKHKLGLTVSSSTSNLKKQSAKRSSKLKENTQGQTGRRQSKLKENTDVFNGIESKSRITITEQQKSKNVI